MKDINLSNIDAEQAVLGTIILNNGYLSRVNDFLLPEHFYEPVHQKIFSQIIYNVEKVNIVANQVTLKQFFDNDREIKEIGGSQYLSTLLSSASGIFDIRDYGFIIIELWRKRELFTAINNINITIGESSIDTLLTKLDDSIKKIDDSLTTLQVFDGKDSLDEWLLRLGEKNSPIPSNVAKLDDRLNGGLHKEGLYVFGAASGTGKTFFAQNIILNALKLDCGVLFASMEMSKRKIMARFLSILSGINYFRVLIGNIFEHEKVNFNYALDRWKDYQKNFFIVEKTSLSPKDIELALKKSLRKSKIELVVVDYAQIMKLRDAKNFNEASLIKENVNALAKLAQKYKVPILLLSQLTKDKISGKVGLGSFKGSGGLYEDADCVIAMWANEENQNQNQSKTKSLQMEVLKNRDGMTGEVSLIFNGDSGQFVQIGF